MRWWQNFAFVSVTWLLVSVCYVVLVAYTTDPFREGALRQLIDHPAFLLETAMAIFAGITITHIAFSLGIPGKVRVARAWIYAVLVMVGWMAFYMYGLFEPALTPSMAGKRELCYVETMTLSVPPLLLGLAMIRRLYPVSRALAGFMIGAAAGIIPAISMQFACMYIVNHILDHHILPIAAVAIVGGLLGAFLLKVPSTTRDSRLDSTD